MVVSASSCVSYQIIIYGRPVIQQRARQGKHGFYDPSSKERKALSLQLLAERVRAAMACLAGDVSIEASFYLQPHGRRKIDVSNMLKALEDSGNGVLWVDDSQIISVKASRYDCEISEERTELEIKSIGIPTAITENKTSGTLGYIQFRRL